MKIFEISRMTNHNGPGFRTLVHFKGCPLRCKWCSTPESQMVEEEIGLNFDRCIGCGACIAVCEAGAIQLGSNGKAVLDWGKCTKCFACLSECYPRALKKYGQEYSAEDLVREIKKDELFFRYSGGGVTFSGGEPLMLVCDETEKLFRGLKEEGISVGVDTCGYVSWENISRLAPYIDFFLWDVKHFDAERHKELTGVSNDLILENLRRVDKELDIDLYIRLPLIPGMTLSEENIRGVCEIVKDLKHLVRFDLLPFHHMGQKRYLYSGKKYLMEGQELIDDEVLEHALEIAQSYHIPCSING